MTFTAARGSGDATRLARLLFDDLASELDRALEATSEAMQSAGSGESAHFSVSVKTDAQVERLLDRAANEARNGILGGAAFEGLSVPEATRLEQSLSDARTVASWGGLTVPEPEAFWAAGVDRAALSRALIADGQLIAVPAPHGLGAERWMSLYRTAARQPGSPLSLASPLLLAQDVDAAFANLDGAPRSASAVADTSERTVAGGGTVTWTLRLIPQTQTPPRTDVSHAFGPHPTLPEMLMLQLMRIARGEDAVDRHSFTWLAGTFAGGRFAARHFFDTAEGSVGVNAREIGNQGPHLGVRPPVGL